MTQARRADSRPLYGQTPRRDSDTHVMTVAAIRAALAAGDVDDDGIRGESEPAHTRETLPAPAMDEGHDDE